MADNDSRAYRFAKPWLAASLALVVGIATTVGLAGVSIPALAAQPLGPTLAEQPAAPSEKAQAPAATPAPAAAEDKPDWLLELQDSLAAARQRIDELSKAAEEVAAAGQQKLVALREENQQLRAEIEAARTERGELDKAKQAGEAQVTKLRSRVQELEGSAAQASAQTARLREEIQASEGRIAAADNARTGAEARLQELRDSLQRAQQDKARAGADLDKAQAELATAKKQLEAAGQDRAQLAQRAAAAEGERDDLRGRLTDVNAQLGRSEQGKAQLESEVGKLREAAATAADDARRSLITLVTRIKDLNQAAAAIGPATGPSETAAPGTRSAGPQVNRKGPSVAAPVETVTAVPIPSERPEPGTSDADLQQLKTANVTGAGGEEEHLDQRGILGGRPAVFSLANLAPEKRQQMRSLLAGLHSSMDERGLITTLPGELLFAAGSDRLQPGARGPLVKVGELIKMYGNRQVLIIGHTDADGDAAQNQLLSERRAESVKQYLVDNFALAPSRLSTEGLGEARPIASNATPEGRSANRRVEVLILN
jgi:outer membrane protein OmpA-like peptidoglycan-associated protein/predicted  nucleic acid-binding Zn-ribbon protein